MQKELFLKQQFWHDLSFIPGMRYSRLFIVILVALTMSACDEQFFIQNSRLSNTEWIVYEWHGSSSCSCPSDGYYSDNNIILDELISRYDGSNDLTQIRFYHDDTFAIVRGDYVRLRGEVRMYSNQIVLYSYSDRLTFDIVREQSNTLVLYAQGYDWLSEVEMVLRKI